MDETHQYFRWLAETWHFHELVYRFRDPSTIATTRRRLRLAKSNLLDAFGAYMNLINKLGQAIGTSWRLIIDENNINYGQWTLTTQQFSVERTNSAASYFFNNMTFLLLEATLAAVV